MAVELDFKEVTDLAKSLRKVAEEGVVKNLTTIGQAKRFWFQEGRRIIAHSVRNPLYESDGTLSEQVSPLALRDKLKGKSNYSNIPYRNGKGVRVVPGNVVAGKQFKSREGVWKAVFPILGRAPGGSSKPPREWMVPIKYRVADGTAERFADFIQASLQAEIDNPRR